MATNVIMPALEMAQESGVLVNWLKHDGDAVTKGEPLMEIETDKVTVEIEATASGILGGVIAQVGDVVPVGRTIAYILSPGETLPATPPVSQPSGRATSGKSGNGSKSASTVDVPKNVSVEVSPLARNIADEHGIDLALVKPSGKRIEKADVMAYLDEQHRSTEPVALSRTGLAITPGRFLASPKARRLASERGLNLGTISGSGPDGAVLAADILTAAEPIRSIDIEKPGRVWRLMAEHMTASWTSVPHFYLEREVDAGNLIEWRKRVKPLVEKRAGVKPTYTDLLVRLIGSALREHPRLNAAWVDGGVQWNEDINIGIATAIEEGLIVPVIQHADVSSLSEIASRRHDLVERAQNHKLHPADISNGTFTLSNLGMYNVDAFNAIVNTPQAAILALGRIADRVVPVHRQAVVKPMMVMTLSCDHRVVDGARAAQFLDDLASLIEDPWRLLS
jgi:pyruvate dehydrogenase E2 component (dihydrolipoamide acetyltransferase)